MTGSFYIRGCSEAGGGRAAEGAKANERQPRNPSAGDAKGASSFVSEADLSVLNSSSGDYYKRVGRHVCQICGREYRWMQSLIRHKREECGKGPQHCCSVCGKQIRHKWKLKRHLIEKHNIVCVSGNGNE
jgi:hypothetical protein